MTHKTQAQRIIDHLKSGRQLTQFEALQDLGIMRLASRISDLKRDGYVIDKKMIEVFNRFGEGCHVASYKLVTVPKHESISA